MSPVTALSYCIVFACLSLFVVSLVNRQQMRRRIIAQKAEQMKRRITELEEFDAIVSPLLESRRLLIHIVSELRELIQKTRALDPSSHYLDTNLHNAEQRLLALDDGTSKNNELWRIQNSDAAIARAQYALNECGRILRKRETADLLSASELQLHIAELAWAHLAVTVVTLIAKGHQALTGGSILKAQAFYKGAHQALANSTHPDERRHQLLKEVGEIMENTRKAISPELMPETEYNP